MKSAQQYTYASDPYRVVRHIRVASCSPDTLRRLNAECEHESGQAVFELERHGRQLKVSYDASHTGLDEVEAILNAHHLVLAPGWWPRVRRGWYQFVDQNVRDNAQHEPWCCHKVPPRNGKPK